MENRIITWKTTKIAANEYEWQVYAFGYRAPTLTLESGVSSTRARAVGRAKSWVRWFKTVPLADQPQRQKRFRRFLS